MKANEIGKKLVGKTLEKIVSKSALPIALLGADDTGNYLTRGLHGVYDLGQVAKDLVTAYAGNSGIREVIGQATMDAIQYVGDVSRNITEHPVETLTAAVGTYLTIKLLPLAVKGAIKGFKKSKPKEEYRNIHMTNLNETCHTT